MQRKFRFFRKYKSVSLKIRVFLHEKKGIRHFIPQKAIFTNNKNFFIHQKNNKNYGKQKIIEEKNVNYIADVMLGMCLLDFSQEKRREQVTGLC